MIVVNLYDISSTPYLNKQIQGIISSLVIIKDKSFALSDVLMLLVINFQDSFGSNKTEAAHAGSFQGCLFIFKQSIAKENSYCREEESATECPRHGDRVRGWRQVGGARGSFTFRI